MVWPKVAGRLQQQEEGRHTLGEGGTKSAGNAGACSRWRKVRRELSTPRPALLSTVSSATCTPTASHMLSQQSVPASAVLDDTRYLVKEGGYKGMGIALEAAALAD